MFLKGKLLVSTSANVALSNPPTELPTVTPCNQEEADTRMFLHVFAMTQDGHKRITIRTVDSDVVVLAITTFAKMEELEELRIAYGTGRSFCHIPVHSIVSHTGVVKASTLGAFLSLTGCDFTSSFFGKGKKTIWKTLHEVPGIRTASSVLSSSDVTVDEVNEAMPTIHKLIVRVYGIQDEGIVDVDTARLALFDKAFSFENMPPSSDALFFHVLRAAYQVYNSCFTYLPLTYHSSLQTHINIM